MWLRTAETDIVCIALRAAERSTGPNCCAKLEAARQMAKQPIDTIEPMRVKLMCVLANFRAGDSSNDSLEDIIRRNRFLSRENPAFQGNSSECPQPAARPPTRPRLKKGLAILSGSGHVLHLCRTARELLYRAARDSKQASWFRNEGPTSAPPVLIQSKVK